jgi:hypothetical protein
MVNGVVPLAFQSHGKVALALRAKSVLRSGWDRRASAPVKAIELLGESPDRGRRYVPVVDGNCVFRQKGWRAT